MSNCTCEPGKHDDKCPATIPGPGSKRRETMSKSDPCAHCGAGIDYCYWAIFTADIGSCCGPCRGKPLHSHEAIPKSPAE